MRKKEEASLHKLDGYSNEDGDLLSRFLDQNPLTLDAIEASNLRLSVSDGAVFFHMTAKGLLVWERGFAGMCEGFGFPYKSDGFDPALPDEHPVNVAWSGQAYVQSEAKIARLKAQPEVDGSKVVRSKSNPRVAVPDFRP